MGTSSCNPKPPKEEGKLTLRAEGIKQNNKIISKPKKITGNKLNTNNSIPKLFKEQETPINNIKSRVNLINPEYKLSVLIITDIHSDISGIKKFCNLPNNKNKCAPLPTYDIIICLGDTTDISPEEQNDHNIRNKYKAETEYIYEQLSDRFHPKEFITCSGNHDPLEYFIGKYKFKKSEAICLHRGECVEIAPQLLCMGNGGCFPSRRLPPRDHILSYKEQLGVSRLGYSYPMQIEEEYISDIRGSISNIYKEEKLGIYYHTGIYTHSHIHTHTNIPPQVLLLTHCGPLMSNTSRYYHLRLNSILAEGIFGLDSIFQQYAHQGIFLANLHGHTHTPFSTQSIYLGTDTICLNPGAFYMGNYMQFQLVRENHSTKWLIEDILHYNYLQ